MSTKAEIEAELVTVRANITSMLANPRPNYRVGDTSMNYGDFLESMYKIRWDLESKLRALPTESWDNFDVTNDEFGRDQAEYNGD